MKKKKNYELKIVKNKSIINIIKVFKNDIFIICVDIYV